MSNDCYIVEAISSGGEDWDFSYRLSCGHMTGWMDIDYKPKFCPECGATVVDNTSGSVVVENANKCGYVVSSPFRGFGRT